jgi:hypothetical protein
MYTYLERQRPLTLTYHLLYTLERRRSLTLTYVHMYFIMYTLSLLCTSLPYFLLKRYHKPRFLIKSSVWVAVDLWKFIHFSTQKMSHSDLAKPNSLYIKSKKILSLGCREFVEIHSFVKPLMIVT